MKTLASLVLTLAWVCAYADLANGSLESLAKKALAEGKDARLNVGFARALGLKTDQALLLKRFQIEKNGTTNVLNVVKDNPNTIIPSERRDALATFYLTDSTGKLSKAIVNDGAVSNGGLTNIPLAAATPGFDKQKLLWLNSQTP